MFRDPLDFVYPAPTTVFKQRKMDVVGQANLLKKLPQRLPPTVPFATKTPPVALHAPTATTLEAASTALEPSATTREAREPQAQKPVLMDTGAPIVVSSAATKAKKPSESNVSEKKRKRNKKGKDRKKRSNAKKAAELVGVADEVDAPVINVVEIIDSGASSAAAVGALPLTVGSGIGYDPSAVVSATSAIEAVEREEKQALETYCESTPAARFAHALHEEAEAAKAKFCPVYAESRRIAALDDCQGPPYIGTEGGVPDSFVMAAMAEERCELEDERLVLFVDSLFEEPVSSPETTSLKQEWKSILRAKKDPMWETKIKPAIQREITKVFEELQTVKVCPYREYEARRLAHPDRTVLLNALMPIIAKLSVDGEFTKVKSRLVVADSVE